MTTYSHRNFIEGIANIPRMTFAMFVLKKLLHLGKYYYIYNNPDAISKLNTEWITITKITTWQFTVWNI